MSPGQELYEDSQRLAPTFNVWLKPWSQLTREEREEWEQMAYEQHQARLEDRND